MSRPIRTHAPRRVLSRVAALVLLLGVLPALAAPSGAEAPGTPGTPRAATPALTQDLCVVTKGKRRGTARVPATGRCAKKEKKVAAVPATPRTLCLARGGRVFLVGKGAITAKTCRKGKVAGARLRGRTTRVPATAPVLLCTRKKSTRWVKKLSTCRDRRSQIVNLAPTGLRLTGAGTLDGAPAGSAVGTLAATDPNRGDTRSWSLVGGSGSSDNAAVRVRGQVLVLAGRLDRADARPLAVRVRATDRLGRSTTAALSVPVTVVPATGLALAPGRVAENEAEGTSVGTVTAQPAGARIDDLRLVAGTGDTDNGSFVLVGDSLVLEATADFEQQNSYAVRVAGTTRSGATLEQALTVDVTDVNEAPNLLDLDAGPLDEMAPAGTVVGHLSAEDPDAGERFTFNVTTPTGDPASDAFTVVDDELRTTRPIRFAETDAGWLEVRVRVVDRGGLDYEQPVQVEVTDLDNAPEDIALSPAAVMENQPSGTVVGTLTAHDDDGGTLTWTLVGTGNDNASFQLAGAELRTATSLTRGERTVRVRVTDPSGLWLERDLVVTVTKLNRAPAVPVLAGSAVDENLPAGSPVGTITTTDPDGDALTLSLSGSGAADFALDGNRLLTSGPLDHEAGATRDLRITATDPDGASAHVDVQITVRDVNEAPTDLTLAGTHIDENLVGPVGALTVLDPDTAQSHTFAVTPASFGVVGGQLRTVAGLDHEATPTVAVTVTATDPGGLAVTRTFTITVDDVDEAPVVAPRTWTGLVPNTRAVHGTTTSGPAVQLAGSLLLDGASDPEGQPVTAIAETVTTSRGGQVTIAADSTFVYTPAPGRSNETDVLVWRVSDGTRTTQARVDLVLGNQRVWYVDPAAPSGGNGTSAQPFTSVSSLSAASDPDGAGDLLYLYAGTHTGTLLLENQQQVRGAGTGLTVAEHELVASGGTSTLTGASGTVLTLANDTTVSGVALTATGNAALISAPNITTTATVGADVTVTGSSSTGPTLTVAGGSGTVDVLGPLVPGTRRPAVDVNQTGSGTVKLGTVTSPGSGSGGIQVRGTGTLDLTGVLTLTTGSGPALDVQGGPTVVTRSSANHLSTTTGTALAVVNSTIGAAGLSFASITTQGAVPGIRLDNTGTQGRFTLGDGVAPAGTIANSTGDGVVLRQTRGPVLRRLAVTGTVGTGIRVEGVSDGFEADTVSVTGSGEDGILVTGTSGTTDVHHSTFSGNRGDHVQVVAGGGASEALVRQNTLTGGTVGAWGQGITITAGAALGSGAFRYDVVGNVVSRAAGHAVTVSGTAVPAGAVVDGLVRDNQLGSTSLPCSTGGDGVAVLNEGGTGRLRVGITGNTVQGCSGRGIRLRTGDGASSLLATVTSNTVTAPGSASSDALSATLGLLPTDTGNSCLDVRANTLTGGTSAAGLRITRGGGALVVSGLASTTSTPATVASTLTDANTAITPAPVIAAGTYTSGPHCAALTLP